MHASANRNTSLLAAATGYNKQMYSGWRKSKLNLPEACQFRFGGWGEAGKAGSGPSLLFSAGTPGKGFVWYMVKLYCCPILCLLSYLPAVILLYCFLLFECEYPEFQQLTAPICRVLLYLDEGGTGTQRVYVYSLRFRELNMCVHNSKSIDSSRHLYIG